jgi:hypothetical protein
MISFFLGFGSEVAQQGTEHFDEIVGSWGARCLAGTEQKG